MERSTRYVLLLHLPNVHGAKQVEHVMRTAIRALPSEPTRTITQDKKRRWHNTWTSPSPLITRSISVIRNYRDNVDRTRTRTDCCVNTYPTAPTSQHSKESLQRIHRNLNGRSRRSLGYSTTEEKFAELVAPCG